MKATITLLPLLALPIALSQTTLSELVCPAGFFPGSDTVLFTVPYTLAQVLSIIGSYGNLTWSGVLPCGLRYLNGTENTVGTARSYPLLGANIVENIKVYSSSPSGPYSEIHDLNLITIPSLNLSLPAPYDGTTVTATCGGLAATFNFTALYCGSNATEAGSLLHQAHTTDVMTVGVFLGGKNFTTCQALGTSNGTGASGTMTTPTAIFAGAADRLGGGAFRAAFGAVAMAALAS